MILSFRLGVTTPIGVSICWQTGVAPADADRLD
jgi:hypothetical protein